SLVDKKILKRVEEKILWFIPCRRYPVVDEQEVTDVERRLRKLLESDAIPDPREAVLVSLVHVCGLFHEILSPREYNRLLPRIEQIAKMDMIGQKVIELVIQINDFANLPPFV
ncbi:MAG: GPP34 family phosphoprotein, partial [Victivallales bacterium]|nr:GPP34 family phosphoprotein [Victivallales bacterium]